jgi:hypothetical protein
MEAVRESWTDARMDDLNRRVDEQGRRMDEGFGFLRAEMNARFEHQESRFDALQRLTVQLWAGTMFALLAGFATLLAAQL